MKCYICKTKEAKRKNLIQTDDDILKPNHFVCDDCIKDIPKGVSIFD